MTSTEKSLPLDSRSDSTKKSHNPSVERIVPVDEDLIMVQCSDQFEKLLRAWKIATGGTLVKPTN